MAFYVEYKEVGTEINGKETFHVPISEGILRTIRRLGKNNRVIELHADGDELELIKNRFKNIPYLPAHTIWTGEMANFIALNFPW